MDHLVRPKPDLTIVAAERHPGDGPSVGAFPYLSLHPGLNPRHPPLNAPLTGTCRTLTFPGKTLKILKKQGVELGIQQPLPLALPLLLLAQIPLLSSPTQAQQTRYALTCLGTNTGTRVSFQYRWGGSGSWNENTAEPGKWTKMLWEYQTPGQNRSPNLTVRYDDNVTAAQNFVVTSLLSYSAKDLNCERSGKTYNFYLKGSELIIRAED